MIKECVLTGSRAYGIPTIQSDYDIVVRCDKDDARIFGFTGIDAEGREYEIDENSWPCKFGEINFILCFTDARFDSWKNGTADCWKIKPVTRDVSKAIIQSYLKKEPQK